ncbi:tRNA (guanosine(46)-N7)-methyltransferase TrmB [Govanella unica]|uniref:tRNA (guanine-N(7)-)-methyltransferase n=1 Tax=Govanella unica TaxID=2975056 RepID=A0A9X3Z814_9PROT|nr:tRNA (guanosine(46)-N7)-methyltransferase TrmB [Govania unica]MDA5194613.1 tRNA (guanosine(46)-N7)-methyltransferase TrmB [Govania unica]
MKPDIQFYGRRKGHPLRLQAQDLVDGLLPQIAVPIPPLGSVLEPRDLFPDPARPLWVEIGFGRGEHCAAQAANNPDVNLIGCEPFMNGVAGLLMEVDARELQNVRILHEDARFLLPALPEASVDRVFLLFPDPWPKKRHHKRRFISPENLDLLARVLKDGGEFRFATDHMDYCRWGLERVMAHPDFDWTAEEAADWRNRPDDWVETRYERKALRKGDSCVYLRFRRRPRG